MIAALEAALGGSGRQVGASAAEAVVLIDERQAGVSVPGGGSDGARLEKRARHTVKLSCPLLWKSIL